MSRFELDNDKLNDMIIKGLLPDAIQRLTEVAEELASGLQTINGARGSSCLSIPSKELLSFPQLCIEAIDELIGKLASAAAQIEEYQKAGAFKKVFATIGMGGIKLLEGLATAGENIMDGFISVAGFFVKSKQEEWGAFIEKDWVGDTTRSLLEDGWLSGIDKYSAMDKDGVAANIFKGVGVATGYMIVAVGTGGVAGLAGSGMSVTAANMITAGVGGLGSGTQSGLQQGLEYNKAFGKGVKEGAINAGAAWIVGKMGGYKGKYENIYNKTQNAGLKANTKIAAKATNKINNITGPKTPEQLVKVTKGEVKIAGNEAKIAKNKVTIAENNVTIAEKAELRTERIEKLKGKITGSGQTTESLGNISAKQVAVTDAKEAVADAKDIATKADDALMASEKKLATIERDMTPEGQAAKAAQNEAAEAKKVVTNHKNTYMKDAQEYDKAVSKLKNNRENLEKYKSNQSALKSENTRPGLNDSTSSVNPGLKDTTTFKPDKKQIRLENKVKNSEELVRSAENELESEKIAFSAAKKNANNLRKIAKEKAAIADEAYNSSRGVLPKIGNNLENIVTKAKNSDIYQTASNFAGKAADSKIGNVVKDVTTIAKNNPKATFYAGEGVIAHNSLKDEVIQSDIYLQQNNKINISKPENIAVGINKELLNNPDSLPAENPEVPVSPGNTDTNNYSQANNSQVKPVGTAIAGSNTATKPIGTATQSSNTSSNPTNPTNTTSNTQSNSVTPNVTPVNPTPNTNPTVDPVIKPDTNPNINNNPVIPNPLPENVVTPTPDNTTVISNGGNHHGGGGYTPSSNTQGGWNNNSWSSGNNTGTTETVTEPTTPTEIPSEINPSNKVSKSKITTTTIPTNLDKTNTKSATGTKTIPVLAGLGAAAAIGVGAKVYMDNKKNNDNGEYDDFDEGMDDEILADEWNENDEETNDIMTNDMGFNEQDNEIITDETYNDMEETSSDDDFGEM